MISDRPTTQKIELVYSPALDFGEAHRHEAGRRDQRAGQHREGGRGVGVGRAPRAGSQPCSSFTIIISTAMMASSTSRPSAMISAPSEMRWKSMPSSIMPTKVMASTSGTDSATMMPVRTAQADERHDQHDGQRLGSE